MKRAFAFLTAATVLAAFPLWAEDEKIAWGKATDGAVASIRALKTTVKPGEPIEFELRIKNVSDKKLRTLTGRGGEKMSPCTWKFRFGEWDWSSAGLSLAAVPLKPGETVSVRCIVATTRDSLTVEQRRRYFPTPFRHLKNKTKTVRLPEGTYRVHGRSLNGSGLNQLETNTIEVRVKGNR